MRTGPSGDGGNAKQPRGRNPPRQVFGSGFKLERDEVRMIRFGIPNQRGVAIRSPAARKASRMEYASSQREFLTVLRKRFFH
jgi:hypothetical protein